jgi:DNA-binding NarL/FixJ family response regulator
MTPPAPAPLVVVASAVAERRRRWRRAVEPPFSVHEVADRATLERSLAHRQPLVLLLDLALPELGGTGGVQALQRVRPSTRILLLTKTADDREGLSALKAGARGYCHADIDPGLLKKATDLVQKGEIWVGRKLIPHLLEELTSATESRQRQASARRDSRLERLTPREREIVDLLSGGANNKEMAKQLDVTERTVKAHLTAIYRKLGVADRLQLALFVIDRGGPGPGRRG